ncbi:MAG: TIGR03862 family flavoprotein [Proteobacteria bacterium]|nr:TIGR03862 family flavoprotein [Pseudomonadota bacterium]
MKNGKNITIIGGGPSGLMAAEIIATAGHQVTIYDAMPTFGRKFLLAGRGGLNLTHSEPLEKFTTRYFESSNWLAPYIKNYDAGELRKWCEGLGQETFVGSSGRVFPRSMKASPLLRAWLKRLDGLGVNYHTRHSWQGFEGDDLIFSNEDEKIIKVKSDATLLALGGISWPHLGSNGSWASILSKCGVKISELRPANCGFITKWSDYLSTNFAGTPLKSVAIKHKNFSHKGEMIITKQGIEGVAVYALSSYLRESIKKDGQAILHIDLRPEMSLEALTKKLPMRDKKSLSNYLRKAGFPPIVGVLLYELITSNQLTTATPETLAGYLKNLPIKLTSTTDISRAISTAGGINHESLDENFMLKTKAGVFAAGEMLDWEAPTGGYLLQGCFSTAVAAAKGILKFIK